MCWGCLRFLFRPSFATVRCSAIYRDIPTWVPRCRCYVSVTVGGATATDGTVSLQSARLCKFGRLVGKGVTQIGGSSVELFATFWGIHGEFGTT